MAPIRNGQYRHRIELQSRTESEDDMGGSDDSWSTDVTVWAKIRPLSSDEINQAAQFRSKVTHEVEIRYRTGITTEHKIVWGSREFTIHGIHNEGERNEKLILRCEEVPAGA